MPQWLFLNFTFLPFFNTYNIAVFYRNTREGYVNFTLFYSTSSKNCELSHICNKVSTVKIENICFRYKKNVNNNILIKILLFNSLGIKGILTIINSLFNAGNINFLISFSAFRFKKIVQDILNPTRASGNICIFCTAIVELRSHGFANCNYKAGNDSNFLFIFIFLDTVKYVKKKK